MILSFKTIKDSKIFLKKDKNNREVRIYNLSNCQLVGDSEFYPNCLIYCKNNKKIYNPLDEKVMSLDKTISKKRPNTYRLKTTKKINEPVFFFVLNVDNYYHFIYDTLTYLISFFWLKQKIKNLKILTNYSGPSHSKFYKFVQEFLEILNIKNEDIVIADKTTIYSQIFISESFTHGINSNLPPRKEIYTFFKRIVKSVKIKTSTPKKIYISRRTWLHNDFSNIGTNYTQRRKLINEDDLVNELKSKGFTEVFTEQLSTKEKIHLFKNAKEVAGAIGGGMVNVLFSKPCTKIHVFVSPTFLDINARFKFSFTGKNTLYYLNTKHVETTKYKKYMRVEIPSKKIVGEICDIKNNKLYVAYTNRAVAGWGQQDKHFIKKFNADDCVPLDNGLNSSWVIKLPL